MQKLKVVVSSWALGMLLAAPAFADIPPQDACRPADEGKACDNAGEQADEPGVCTKDSCTKQSPNGPLTYDCHICKVADADDTPPKSNDGGCSVSVSSAGGFESLIVPLAAFGLAAIRRRRSRR